MTGELRARIGAALGSTIRAWRPVHGGDINDAFAADLAGGRRVFVKTNARAAPEMFAREAEGLAWLAEPNVLPVPEVLAVGPDFLVLEFIDAASAVADFDERLGRGLAALHRSGADGFGWPRDNFIADLPQLNDPQQTWPQFYVERRLAPQLERAVAAGRATANMRRAFERLFERIDELVEPTEPSRLHGDLWGGNCHRDERGLPVLIDPAVYGGSREIDLAMMRLFGGFGDRVFAAYDEAWPLADGWQERVRLYQLYPLMVHVNLFGGHYARSVERALHELI